MRESADAGSSRGDVWFISHGSPMTLYDAGTPPHRALQTTGKRIRASKTKGLVLVSAHWESEDSYIRVNTNPANPLIYDFGGFPDKLYREQFKSQGTPDMLDEIQGSLSRHGVKHKGVNRGLDHGVWGPLKVGFGEGCDLPLIQVSLPGSGDPNDAVKLGKALSDMRDQGYTLVCSGQPVHNLRDYFTNRATNYTGPFLQAISSAVTGPKPLDSTLALFKHPLYHNAHPTPEHFLPLVVAAGAAREDDKVDEVFVSDDKLGWGSWHWTSV